MNFEFRIGNGIGVSKENKSEEFTQLSPVRVYGYPVRLGLGFRVRIASGLRSSAVKIA